MKGNRNRESTRLGEGVKHRVLRALVVLAVLALPIAAYTLGVHVVTRGGVTSQPQYLLRSQALVVLTALVVSGVGGFLIWSAARSLARVTEAEARRQRRDDGPADRLMESAALTTSVTRMLATIERQTDEINQFPGRLDSAYRELESANARLREVSFTDEVTGFYNRRFFAVRLEEEVARYRRFGHPLSLVRLDLGGFETINDALGHLARDEALRGVALVLLKNSRGVDVISRYGADEFAILLVETPRSEAGLYARRIRDTLSTYSWSHGRQVAASFGIASLPEDVSSSDDLVRAADEALHVAKRAGENCVAALGESGTGSPAPHEVPAA